MEIQKHINFDTPVNENRPVIQLQYTYPYNFATIASAFVQKYNLEPRSHLTTTTGIQQLDEDRFIFYRRCESVVSTDVDWEKVTVDRRNGGSITSELVRPAPLGDKVYERGILTAVEGDKTQHVHNVILDQGIKSWKVEFFKLNVSKVIKAVKFAQFAQQE